MSLNVDCQLRGNEICQYLSRITVVNYIVAIFEGEEKYRHFSFLNIHH